jgi:glycosyltransferase involved in cell wall biosynthesis
MILINKTKKKEPLVSIITVTLNSEKYLEETLKSIKNQKNKDYELIIIDGQSIDTTIEIIKRYEDLINFCLIEKDNGIYDAFNKGLKYANGKYIVFVNSDDVLTPEALELLSTYDKKYKDIDFLFGSVKKHWGVLYGYKPHKIRFTWGFYSSHSTGFYIKRVSAKKIGEYNLKYKFHADFDYFYRMIVKHKMKGIGTGKSELFGIFRRGGFSSKIDFKKSYLEDLKIRIDNGQSYFTVAILALFKFIKNFQRFF